MKNKPSGLKRQRRSGQWPEDPVWKIVVIAYWKGFKIWCVKLPKQRFADQKIPT
jgi:hypothetical protein